MSSSDESSEEERSSKKKKSVDKKDRKQKKKKRSRDSDSESVGENNNSDVNKKERKQKKKKRSRESSSSESESESSSSSSEEDSSSKKRKKGKKTKKSKKSGNSSKSHKKDKKKKSKKNKKEPTEEKKSGAVSEPVKIPEREKVGLVEEVASSRFGMTEKKILRVGTGRKPERGQTVTVSGTGYIEAGMRPFWSTSDKYAKPYSFAAGIGRVVAGWDAGVMAMRIGEKARITMTGSFGYGMKGNAELKIPSMANLVIDLELLAIGEEINLPTPEEIAKAKIASKPVFVERDKDPDISRQLSFNSAPF